MLQSEHLELKTPPESPLLVSEDLLAVEEVEITGSRIQSVATSIQGGAGPGGCDTTHWENPLLPFGAHSDRLQDSVTALAHRLLNTIIPWEDIRSLMAYRIIAMDKCPGVQPLWCWGNSLMDNWKSCLARSQIGC